MAFQSSIIPLFITYFCIIVANKTNLDADNQLMFVSSPTSIQFTVAENYTLLDVKCKSLKHKNEVSKKTNNFTCQNLEPCSNYLVSGKYEDGKHTIFNHTLFAAANYSKPEFAIDIILPSNDSIYLSWNVTNRMCISKFNIIVLHKNIIVKTILLDNDQSFVEISQLSPCEQYVLMVEVFDIHNDLIDSFKTTVDTSFSGPDLVQNVSFSENEDTSMSVNWLSPKSESCIQYYYLKLTKVDCLEKNPEKCAWRYYNYTDQETLEHKQMRIDGLDSCVQYLLIISPNGDHMENVFNTTFRAKEQVPGSVEDLKVNKKTATEISVEWKPPAGNGTCIEKYEVNLAGPDRNTTTNITITNVDFKDLKPCGLYNVTVVPITKNFKGKPKTESFTMPEAKPSPVRNPLVRTYPNEFAISWEVPEFAELCIARYMVRGWSKGEVHNDTNAKFKLYQNEYFINAKNLVSCKEYEIEIVPLTKASTETEGEGTPVMLEATTTAMVSDVPQDPEKKSATSHSLELTTNEQDQNNQCAILYARFTCDTDEEGKIPFAEQIVTGDLGKFSAILTPMSPFTTYMCKAWFFNIAGWSKYSSARLKTGTYYPSVPQSITAEATPNSTITIKWKEPFFLNGNYVIYKVYIQALGPKYKVPSHCPPIKLESFTQTVESQNEYIFKDALPYFQYSIQIASKNDYGTGDYSPPLIVTTYPWTPDPVENFTLSDMFGPEESPEYKASITLSWQLPCQSNGEIVHFEGNFVGTRLNYDRHEFNWSYPVENQSQDIFEYEESNLKPEYNYEVSIAAIINDIDKSSEPKRIEFLSPAGIPIANNVTGQAIANAFAAKNPTTSAVVAFSQDILQSDMGNILYAAILISQQGCQDEPLMKYGIINSLENWPKIANWYDVQYQECIPQYQTTPIRWQPHKNRWHDMTTKIDIEKPLKYDVGVEICTSQSSFCNGALKPDTNYTAVVRLFTQSGFNDVVRMEFKTDSVVQLYFILLLIVMCLLCAFFAGFLYIWISKRMKWHRDSLNGIDDQSGDISAKNFFIHYVELTKRDKLQREFKELTVVANDLSLLNTASKSNESKNRYGDVFPYDKNRVILDSDSDGSDYINASFINGYKHKKEYIATQGPKPETLIDFWKMILQYNVRIIIMLTQFREGELIKCHQYYPQLSKQMKFGHNIEVKCTKETSHELYDRREMLVEHTGDSIMQKVIHYYFRKWPDHDCPEDPNDLIWFVRKVKSEKIPNHSPIVVHCSAGVGRTGTFIGLDMLMQRLKSERKVNIFETVKELRFQRMKMVQTIQQYQFLYSCSYHLVKRKFSSKKINNSKDCTNESINLGRPDSSKKLSFSPNDIESLM